LMRGEIQPAAHYENPVLTRSGEERTVAWHNIILTGDEGQTIGTLSSGDDITEAKLVEAERARLLAQIQAQAQQMRQIVNTVPDGMLLLDAQQRILLANPAAEKYLDTLGSSSIDGRLTHLGNRPLAELLAPLPQGLWYEVTTNTRHFEISSQPIEVRPEMDGWVLVIRDVTQEREIQQRIHQQERLASVGQLAAGIAHDFNNIMAVIVLYVQMALRTPELPARIHERLRTVAEQARRATELIQQILDFSRRAVLERRPMDLVPFLKEQVKLLERTLPESIKIELTYSADDHIANADPTRMQQVIMNLALNARDAMPNGGKLAICLKRVQIKDGACAPLLDMAPGEWIQITVSDNGTGIPFDVLPRIFEPFFTTKAPLGSGLGLAQAYGIIKQHTGEINVSTQTDKGTTFSIFLPALTLPAPEPLSPVRQSIPMGRGETILVVEDDAAT